ncbi:methyltransferase [Toxoplasma gondii RUB]|uniref:carnosine N-methyltransferase n=1 Tax=Toxoplasma gondii RUB TaxID=935652 RepID=A0A086LKC7_TOXGO|nr:methyltransferase [Toxoplasma gondii RUB]
MTEEDAGRRDLEATIASMRLYGASAGRKIAKMERAFWALEPSESLLLTRAEECSTVAEKQQESEMAVGDTGATRRPAESGRKEQEELESQKPPDTGAGEGSNGTETGGAGDASRKERRPGSSERGDLGDRDGEQTGDRIQKDLGAGLEIQAGGEKGTASQGREAAEANSEGRLRKETKRDLSGCSREGTDHEVALSAHYARISALLKKLSPVRAAVAANQRFLNDLVDSFFQTSPLRGERYTMLRQSPRLSQVPEVYVFNTESLLRQVAREWSTEGGEERRTSFDPLLDALEKFLPCKDNDSHGHTRQHRTASRPRVLVPGCGTGRLPFEIAQRGYWCEANEASYHMFVALNFFFNTCAEPHSKIIFPYCLGASNRAHAADNVQGIAVPDIVPRLVSEGHIQLRFGDFFEVYSDHRCGWDGVVTCFFLDATRSVLKCIDTVMKLLRQGVWICVGPALYHFADDPTDPALQLAWDEILASVKVGFKLVEERWTNLEYASDSNSLLQTTYRCKFFVGIRR